MYDKELSIAIHAVQSGMEISRQIQREMTGGDTLTKSDRSPVTIADFSTQAIICRILNNAFPEIPVVGEENASALAEAKNKNLLDRIQHYLNGCSPDKWGPEKILQAISIGDSKPGNYYWTLDPIDGTKGFLRNDQFAIALALIHDGQVELGVLGCPALSLSGCPSSRGLLFYAQKNMGTFLLNMETTERTRIKVSGRQTSADFRFVQSFETGHSNHELQETMMHKLGITAAPVLMDSQAKYGVIASGHAEIYLRIPNPNTPDYREKIWDHAAGSLVVTEAGGVVSDMLGNELNFNCGKKLQKNIGILATVPSIQRQILKIYSASQS